MADDHDDVSAVPLEALPLPAVLLGPDGRVHGANRRCLEMLGDSASADHGPVGQHVSCFFPDEAGAHERICRAAADGRPIRLQGRRHNHVPFSVDVFASESTAPRDQDGSGVARSLLCVLREIREQQLLDETLHWLDRAFEQAPVGMALFDTDGRYVRVNTALCEMLRRTPEELIGRRDQEMTHPDDRQRDVEAAWKVLNGEWDRWQTEKRFLDRDGHTLWAIANLSFVRDEAGRPLCWLGQFQDISAQRARQDELRRLAERDDLTGVANRRRLLEELTARLGDVVRHGDRGAVIVLDLDGFKAINDRHGHQAGDRVLVGVARRLGHNLRPTDLLARLGGDEFAILLAHRDAHAAREVAARLIASVPGDTLEPLTASCGIAVYGPDRAISAEHVLELADRAMYQAKSAGRGVAVLAAEEYYAFG